MRTGTNKRQFDRFQIDFHMEVLVQDNEGRVLREQTTLEDISGEGARFLTRKAERYSLGKSLELIIYLPGTDEVKAFMRGKARVVRIEPCSNAASSGQSQPVCVAVKLDAALYFERYSSL
jgi:hypothetical protein